MVKGESLAALPPSVLAGNGSRSRRRQLPAAAVRAARRMGNPHRLRGHRIADADDAARRVIGRWTIKPAALGSGRQASGLYEGTPAPPLHLRRARRSLAATAVHAALPTFWQVSTESEFLKGEFENLSIDSFGRLTLGPTAAPLYESSAPFLWTLLTAPDGSVYAGSGNDGQVFRVDPSGKATRVLRRRRARGPRHRAGAGRRPLRRHLADGKIYKVDAAGKGDGLLRPGRQVHLEPRGRSTRQRLRGHRRQRRHLQDHARRQRRALLSDQGHARHDARLRSRRAACSPAPNRPAACSRSMPRASRSCCSTPATTRSITLRVDRRRRDLRGRRPQTAPGRTSQPDTDPTPATGNDAHAASASPPRSRPSPSSTSNRRTARRHRARPSGQCTGASLPDHAGRRVRSDLGVARRHAVRHRVPGRSRRCSWPPATRARSTVSAGDPYQPTLVSRVNAEQVTDAHA